MDIVILYILWSVSFSTNVQVVEQVIEVARIENIHLFLYVRRYNSIQLQVGRHDVVQQVSQFREETLLLTLVILECENLLKLVEYNE